MPHGARKWSNIGPDEVVFGLSDLAEAVARLNSIVTHNREGNVVFLEDFEHGLSRWMVGAYGTGSEVLISAQACRSGGFSCKLVGGLDGARQAEIFRKCPYPALSRYGFEISFLLEAHTEQLSWKLVHHDGVREYQFHCRYNVGDRDLTIQIEDGNFVTVDTDLNLPFQYASFHTAKVIGDFNTHKYVRLVVNNVEYDLSEYSAYPWPNPDGPHARITVFLKSEAGHNGFSYIDDLVLTYNEPS